MTAPTIIMISKYKLKVEVEPWVSVCVTGAAVVAGAVVVASNVGVVVGTVVGSNVVTVVVG